jgi:hypothetical protein
VLPGGRTCRLISVSGPASMRCWYQPGCLATSR